MKQTTPSSRPGDNLPSAAAAGKKTRRRRVIILIVVLLLVLAAALFFLLPRLPGGAPETRLTLTAIFMPGVTQERSPQAASRALWQAV